MQAKTCPVCGRENTTKALVCANCHTSFTPGQTMEIPVTLPLTQPRNHLANRSVAARLADLNPGALVFLVTGYEEPIMVPYRQKIIMIGRRTSNGPDVDVDLSSFQAETLGISRTHACIYQRDGKFILEDMNSTNGTRLNGGVLHPHTPYYVQSGDSLRFGKLTLELFYSKENPKDSTRPLDMTQPFARQG